MSAARASSCPPRPRGARAARGARARAATRCGCWSPTRASRRDRARTLRAICPTFLAPGDLLVVNIVGDAPGRARRARADGTRAARPRRRRRRRRPASDWWVVELRTRRRRAPVGGRAPASGSRSPAAPPLELVAPYATARRLWLARLRRRASRSPDAPRPPRRADPLRLRAAGAGRCAATRPSFAHRARQRRDAERRAPVHARADHAARRAGRARRADHAAHRRLLARAPRAALPRALRRAPRRPPGWSTRVRAGGGRVVAVGTTVVRALETCAAPDGGGRAGRGLDEPRRHPRARAARGRRAAHRLARAARPRTC